jgi:abortive infection bacteriophage resistance protein
MGGYLFFGGGVMRFTKAPKTFSEQLGLLVSRGMLINDHDRVLRYLRHLNYYRLTAYWLPFEEDHATHQFKPGTTFDKVLELYIFDRELWLLIMDAVERFEVSLRTHWAYHLAHAYGPHAHLDATLFKPDRMPQWRHRDAIAALQETVRLSSEVFIRHLRDTYEEALPPIWALCEIMTFGQLSKWFANLAKRSDRNAIARQYDMDEQNLASFLHHLSTVRNYCAHHARLWNREFTISWSLPLHRPAAVVDSLNRHNSKRIYNALAMLACLMDIINPGHHWKQRLGDLLNRHPGVRTVAMGFPEDWQNMPIWREKNCKIARLPGMQRI